MRWPPPPPGDLLLDGLGVGLGEQVQHGAAEVVGVAVGVAQLVGYGVQEQVAAWRERRQGRRESSETVWMVTDPTSRKPLQHLHGRAARYYGKYRLDDTYCRS